MDPPKRRFFFVNRTSVRKTRKQTAAQHLILMLSKSDSGDNITAKEIADWLAETQTDVRQITLRIKNPHWTLVLLEAINLYLKRPDGATVYSLTLGGMLSTPRFSDLFRGAVTSSNIRSLVVAQVFPFTLLNIHLLSEVLTDNPRLETLGLSISTNKTQITHEKMEATAALMPLMRAISNMPALKCLALMMCETPSAIVGTISHILASTATIREVWLCVRSFTSVDAEALADALVVNNTLDWLVLNEYDGDDNDATSDISPFRPLCRALCKPLAVRLIDFPCRLMTSTTAIELTGARSSLPFNLYLRQPSPVLEFRSPYQNYRAEHIASSFSGFTDIDGYVRRRTSNHVVVDCPARRANTNTSHMTLVDQISNNIYTDLRVELVMPNESDIVTFRDKLDIDRREKIKSLTITSPTHNALASLFRVRPETHKRLKQ